MKTPKTFSKVLSVLLAMLMVLGVAPTSVLAQGIDDPLSGSTGSGWEDYGGEASDFGDDSLTVYTYDDDTGEVDTHEVSPDDPDLVIAEELPAADDSEQPAEKESIMPLGLSGGEGQPLEWAENLYQFHLKNSRLRGGLVNTVPITWGGGKIQFANTKFVGSGRLVFITYSGKTAFCAEFNGQDPGGSYLDGQEQHDAKIKTIIASYEEAVRGGADEKGAYVAAQGLIWAHLDGTSVTDWGGSNPDQGVLALSGNADNVQYWYHVKKDDKYQNLFTFKYEDIPDTPDEPGTPTEDGEAWGEVTIIKKDHRDEPLKNAIFKIEIKFKNGGLGGNDRFQVVNGSDTYHYQHPEGDTGPATVTVTEVEAPDGYVKDGTPQTLVINPSYHIYEEDEDGNVIKDEMHHGDKGKTVELTFKNHPAEAELHIYKYQKGNSSIALAGAQFEISTVDTHLGDPWSIVKTTDQNGYIKLSLPRAGTYKVREIKAPEGYVINVDGDGNTHLFTEVARGETKRLDIPNDKKGSLEVIKKDAQDGQVLSGAEFTVTYIDTNEVKQGTTDSNGSIVFSDLTPGDYEVREVKPPQYYELSENPVQTLKVFEGSHQQHKMIFYNEPWTGIRILKLDSKNANRLQGAVFGLYEGAEMNADGLPAGHLKSEYVSNENGEVVIEKLKPGAYAIVEHQAPEGYTLDKNRVRVIRVDPDDPNREIQVVFRNDPLPDLEIIKRDKETGELLPGATFTLRHEDGAEYDDVTTGPDGKVLVEKLPLGWYTITEIRQPTGYLLPTEEIPPVELVVGKKTEVVIYNQKMPGLEIIKKDKATGELLPGATFRISWNNGADFRDVETGENGKALVEGLKDGWYTITEIKAPEGYLLNTEPYQVQLEGGTVTPIEIYNEAKPSLEILKIDDKTKTPLQYAKFKIERKTEKGVELIGNFVSDEDGIIYLEDTPPGRYLITETEAPDGYSISDRTQEVTIEFGQKYELEFTNKAKQPIYIAKVDQDGNPLAGAKFVVKTMNGAMVGTVTTGRTGYGIIPYAEPGWYTVEEVQAPDGYILNNTPVNVEVKMNMPAELEFVNEKAPGLEILKLDAEDQKALIGARFKVAKSNGEIIGEYETDNNGLIILDDLKPDTYVITEIRSPDGYILDITPTTVVLKAGETKRVEFFNASKPGLQLIKKDKLTGLPVGGARFSLVELQGSAKKDHGTFTTGENGMFYVPDLTPGHYAITEIQAAEGYILDPTPQQVYIEGGKLNSVEFFNMPYSDLRLLKIDSETRDPLPGAVFKLFDDKRIEVGTYTTSELGEIYISGLPSGEYYLQEVKAPDGYVLDNTVRKVELHGGKTTTVEWKNTELGTLRIVKVDAKTGKPLYGATFLLYDNRNNILGEFHTEQDGTITFGRNLQAGTYKVKEIKSPDGYVLNDMVYTVRVKPGTTTELIVENELEVGTIQISKVSSAPNEITKDKEGASLQGVVFEIYNNQMELVDTITTDKNGIATSDLLPLGVYGIKEITPADYYVAQDEMFYAHIKVHDDLVKFTVKNDPVHLNTSVEKRGNAEVQAGDSMYYTLSEIRNLSSVPLEEFYIHDVLPVDAVRLEKIWTGTWSERSKLEVQIKTNAKPNYRTVKTGLLSDNNNEIDCSPSALGLAGGEYVTEFRIVFLEPVSAGFHNTTDLKVQVKVLETLSTKGEKLCYQFTNKVDVGGRYLKEWTYTTDGWTTTVWCRKRGRLPRTGL